MKGRTWLLANGRKLMTPTDEFTPEYYGFLNSLGISELTPKFTFVSHHMLFQPQIMREILSKIGASEARALMDLCLSPALKDFGDIASLDYELYAQFFMSQHPEKVYMGRWGNLALPKSAFERISTSRVWMKLLEKNLNSLTFHSWS
jgi:hypothetical protein